MKYIWIIKLKLKDEFREQIEEYFLSLNASIASIDAENNSNTLKPKIFYTNVFFTYKPNIILVKKYLLNFKINIKNIIFFKNNIQKLNLHTIKKFNPINIGRFIFSEEKINLERRLKNIFYL